MAIQKKEIKPDEKSSDAKEDEENSEEKEVDSLKIDPKILERSISFFYLKLKGIKNFRPIIPIALMVKK
jgi:hypothetical protein